MATMTGEVYRITNETVVMLDQMMGKGLFFSRDEVTAKVGDRIMTTWMYLFLDNPGSYTVVQPAIGQIKEWTRCA